MTPTTSTRCEFELDRPADDRRVAAEARLPEPVADERDARAAGHVLLAAGSDGRACGSTPRNGKNWRPPSRPGRSADCGAAEDRLLAGRDGQLFERLAAIAIVAIVERMHRRQVLRAVAEDVPQDREPLGALYGSGLSSTPFTRLKSAVLAPTPSASVATARGRGPCGARASGMRIGSPGSSPPILPVNAGIRHPALESSYRSSGMTIQRMR